ncbi:MAG: hypothetical protein GY696_35080, partial [Gammaproteobacteria bacterium]|nr:hypothetical protein [Gammaproteobacteria bacterium]
MHLASVVLVFDVSNLPWTFGQRWGDGSPPPQHHQLPLECESSHQRTVLDEVGQDKDEGGQDEREQKQSSSDPPG